MMNPGLQQYLDQVARLMQLNRRQKEQLFVKVGAELEDQLQDQSGADYQQLVELLGRPEAMAADLSELEPFADRMDAVKRANRRLRWLAIAAAIAVVVIGAFCVFLALTQPGYYLVETVQVP